MTKELESKMCNFSLFWVACTPCGVHYAHHVVNMHTMVHHAHHMVYTMHTTYTCTPWYTTWCTPCTPCGVHHAHHSTPWYTTWCTPCTPWYTTWWCTPHHGVHLAWCTFQSNLTPKLCDHSSQPIRRLHSLKSLWLCEKSWDFTPNFSPFKEQSCYNSSAKNPNQGM